jgi:uncharacterized protein YecE (DUF72 family)
VFAKWRDETPNDFVFSLKAPRFLVNRRDLRTMAEGLPRFINSGLSQLRTKLGPLLWQLAPFKKFDKDDIGAFLSLLPRKLDGRDLRHVLEVRHESFLVPAFVDLLEEQGVATVYADSDEYPAIADATADFIYARLQKAEEGEAAGYAPAALDKWAKRAATWASGDAPADLKTIDKPKKSKRKRDVFIFMINGFKPRAPAAAMALIERLAKQK